MSTMKIVPIEVTLIDHCGSDLSVVNAARVSFHKESKLEFIKEGKFGGVDEWRLSDKDVKLINYLAKHEHKSPFNHCFLSFRVKAPIFCARQMVKHKFMPWNEVSRRYVDEEPEFYFPARNNWRAKATDKKQGSSDDVIDVCEYGNDYTEYIPFDSVEVALEAYQRMLAKGVCPEQARMVLPQNMITTWIWSGTLGAFCDMLRLRLKPDTQEETRQVAELISKHVSKLFPVSYGALVNE